MKENKGGIPKEKKEAACEPCRRSHVKCDRAKPACGVCTRRGIQHRCFGAEGYEEQGILSVRGERRRDAERESAEERRERGESGREESEGMIR